MKRDARSLAATGGASRTAQTALPGDPSSGGYHPGRALMVWTSSSPRPFSSSSPASPARGTPGQKSRTRMASSPRPRVRTSRKKAAPGRVLQRRTRGRPAPAPPARQASRSPGPPPWPSPHPPFPGRPVPGKPAGQRADAGTCTLSSAANVKPEHHASAARPWPSVKQPMVRTDRPSGTHARPLCVRGRRNMTVHSATR
jgi:hypothetical protein